MNLTKKEVIFYYYLCTGMQEHYIQEALTYYNEHREQPFKHLIQAYHAVDLGEQPIFSISKLEYFIDNYKDVGIQLQSDTISKAEEQAYTRYQALGSLEQSVSCSSTFGQEYLAEMSKNMPNSYYAPGFIPELSKVKYEAVNGKLADNISINECKGSVVEIGRYLLNKCKLKAK